LDTERRTYAFLANKNGIQKGKEKEQWKRKKEKDFVHVLHFYTLKFVSIPF